MEEASDHHALNILASEWDHGLSTPGGEVFPSVKVSLVIDAHPQSLSILMFKKNFLIYILILYNVLVSLQFHL